MLNKNKNIKLLVNYGVGPLLFIWLAYSIYHQLQHQPDLGIALKKLEKNIYGKPPWRLYAALFLMLLNWGVEARKWQVLLKPLESIHFLKSFQAILSGIAFSMNTPNRIGEFGGRVLFVKMGHRWKAVSLTIMGSFSQLIITFIFGAGGLIFLLSNASTAPAISSYFLWIRVLCFVTLVASLCLLVFYFRAGWMLQWLEKIPKASRFLQHLIIIEDLPVTILLRVLSLSLTRYIIFIIQYILLLNLFDVQIGIWQAFWLISILYLVLAMIPTVALAELGIRGQVSLVLFTLVSTNNLGIVSAAATIWFINLVIPALAGSLLILSTKIFSDK